MVQQVAPVAVRAIVLGVVGMSAQDVAILSVIRGGTLSSEALVTIANLVVRRELRGEVLDVIHDVQARFSAEHASAEPVTLGGDIAALGEDSSLTATGIVLQHANAVTSLPGPLELTKTPHGYELRLPASTR